MANRNFNTAQALEKQVKLLHWTVEVSGSGDISSFSGLGASATLQAGGVYRITPQDTYPAALAVHADWQPATTASANLSINPKLVAVDVTSSTPRLDFVLTSGSAAGVVSAGVAGTLHVSAFLRNSVV